MEKLGNQYAVKALRERRAEVSGEIATLKKRITNLEATLLHLDGALRCFDPDIDTGSIPDRQFALNVKPWSGGKMNRLILNALRKAEKPLSTHEVVQAVASDLGYGEDAVRGMKHHVRSNLGYLATHRGLIVKDGERKDARWSLPQHQEQPCLPSGQREDDLTLALKQLCPGRNTASV